MKKSSIHINCTEEEKEQFYKIYYLAKSKGNNGKLIDVLLYIMMEYEKRFNNEL